MARDKLKKKIATYKEGVTIRTQQIEKAKLKIAKEEEELSKLKREEKILKGLVQQLKGMVFFHVVSYYWLLCFLSTKFSHHSHDHYPVHIPIPAFYKYLKNPIQYI